MTRSTLFEIHDHPACPNAIRNGMRSFLQFFSEILPMFSTIVPKLKEPMHASGATEVVDLCSGSGGPWLKLIPHFSRNGTPLTRITMSDLYPDSVAVAYLTQKAGGRVRFVPHPVDAAEVPGELTGFRTIFSSFHHFEPDKARAVLRNAMEMGVGIGIFEATRRSAWSILCVASISIVVSFASAAIITPFRWSNLFWTYVIPLLPFVVAYDGVISCLKTYSLDEMEQMVADLQKPGYRWRIGKTRSLMSPLGVTYLIGHPVRSEGTVSR